MRSVSSSADDTRAYDAHRTATILTLLVFLWGTLSLAYVPWEPFWIPNIGQAVVCAAFLVYLVRTWKRPHRRAAEGITALLLVYALVLLPWTAIVWCRLGRPVEAFTIPQGAVVSIALVFPGRWSLGVVALGLFAAEGLFAYIYAQHLGLGDLVPVTEPINTSAFTALGIGLFVLRRRRRDLARQHVRVEAEIQALDRVRPLFAHAREELEAQVNVLASEVRATDVDKTNKLASSMGRALDRLGDLRGQLGSLVSGKDLATAPKDAERRLLDRDTQLGAILFAGLGAIVAGGAALWLRDLLVEYPNPWLVLKAVFDAVMLAYLLATRRRPSTRRAFWAVLVMFVTALAVVAYDQVWLLEVHRPFSPFIGHKLFMGIVGLTLGARFRLGVVLILVTTANAIALWFTLDLGAHQDVVSFGEPWVTLIYMSIALISLRMDQQRHIASVQLLHDEAEASAMQRRALMFLALRDRLNSPLQTLVIGATGVAAHLPESSNQRMQEAVDRLLALSRELAELDVLVPQPTSLDAENELRRQI